MLGPGSDPLQCLSLQTSDLCSSSAAKLVQTSHLGEKNLTFSFLTPGKVHQQGYGCFIQSVLNSGRFLDRMPQSRRVSTRNEEYYRPMQIDKSPDPGSRTLVVGSDFKSNQRIILLVQFSILSIQMGHKLFKLCGLNKVLVET